MRFSLHVDSEVSLSIEGSNDEGLIVYFHTRARVASEELADELEDLARRLRAGEGDPDE